MNTVLAAGIFFGSWQKTAREKMKAEEAKKEIARGFEELGIMAKSIITSPGILGTHRI